MIIFSIIGGILFRMRGGWPDIPRPIEQTLFCLPIIFICLISLGWWGFIPAILSVVAVLKGHGNNMDLGTWEKPVGDEWYEFTIKWLKPRMSEYWYDVLGIGVSGLTYTLPLVVINPLLAFSGLLKAPAYMLGWNMHPNYDDGKIKLRVGKFELVSATEWGEFFTGLFIWAALLTYIEGIF